jgi:hypothetical protein
MKRRIPRAYKIDGSKTKMPSHLDYILTYLPDATLV